MADIASATARALVGGEAIWADPPRKVNRAQIADDSARSSLAIEARLSTYMPGRIVTAWQIYAWMVDRFTEAVACRRKLRSNRPPTVCQMTSMPR